MGIITKDNRTLISEFKDYTIIEVPILADGGGAVADITLKGFSGFLEYVKYALGSTNPTDLFDVVINDKYSIDILGGAGADIVSASPAFILPDNGGIKGCTLFTGDLTIQVSNNSVADADFKLVVCIS